LAKQEIGRRLVEVEDDGCGFRLNEKGTAARTAGLGIVGMRERAAMLGGQLNIQSSPGRGTKISMNLPVATLSAAEPLLKLERDA
jgi:signal transduction histidine kinase